MLAHPLVHALVAAAQQHEVGDLGELTRDDLGEAPTRGVEEDDASSGGPQGLDAAGERLGLHDHPAPAPEGRVVRHAVPPLRPVA